MHFIIIDNGMLTDASDQGFDLADPCVRPAAPSSVSNRI
jgi:hypothetical protein